MQFRGEDGQKNDSPRSEKEAAEDLDQVRTMQQGDVSWPCGKEGTHGHRAIFSIKRRLSREPQAEYQGKGKLCRSQGLVSGSGIHRCC